MNYILIIVGIIIGLIFGYLASWVFFSSKVATLVANTKSLKERLSQYEGESDSLEKRLEKIFQEKAKSELNEKTIQLSKINKDELSEILDPLKEQIKNFSEQYVEGQEKISLDTAEIKGSAQILKGIGESADRFAQTLSGDKKEQGNWGEFKLESILINSGLEKGVDFKTQDYLKGEEIGKKGFADVLVNLPDGGKLIIDSKLSLKSYDEYVHEKDITKKKNHLDELVKRTNERMTELSTKKYWKAKNIETPDYVLMFVPIDNIFNLVVSHDEKIYEKAYNKNILIVGPTLLMAALRTIASLYKQIKMNQNAELIAQSAGRMYDKFVDFLEHLEKIKNSLKTAQEHFDQAEKKLHKGRDSIIEKATKIKELGAVAAKEIDERN